MKRLATFAFSTLLFSSIVAGTAVAAGCMSAGASPDLKVGDPAPPFALPGSDGKTHRLADHAGKEAVVVAWFPKAFTGG